MKRRNFIKNTAVAGIGLAVARTTVNCSDKDGKEQLVINAPQVSLPLVIATWNVPNATNKAWEVLSTKKSALDAVEQGCMVEEADLNNSSVGKAGLPDRDGNVTLDACIMNAEGDCGSVVYLQHITHAISVARTGSVLSLLGLPGRR